MTNQLQQFGDTLFDSLVNGTLAWQLLAGFLCLLCLFSAVRAARNAAKRQWASFWFVLLCGAILVWAGASFARASLPAYTNSDALVRLQTAGAVFVPALVCLHTWKQVSYKGIGPVVAIAALAIPVLLAAYLLIGTTVPALRLPTIATYPLDTAIFYVYAAVAYIKAYLLCLNVFYQMPKHMRRSAYYLLIGISAMVLTTFLPLILTRLPQYDYALGGAVVALFCFSDAFRTLSSANVIVTSRDFVFGNLSTQILVLSRSQRILDWNKKDAPDPVHLPKPVYKEPFQHYRSRILKEENGRVSPHGDNIITTMQADGTERHYLIVIHEVHQKKRQFGYLVEISEVTKIYSVLRYLEEIAVVDQLTGLYNRNAYLGMVHTLTQAQNMPLAVIVGDVNHLKTLNDTYGHLCGDALLTGVAAAITQAAPTGAFASRIGGDEFVVLAPQLGAEGAESFIRAVNQLCSEIHDERFGTPSISWGYALMHTATENYNEVFAKADGMMYADKKANFKFRSSGFVPDAQGAFTGNTPSTAPPPTAQRTAAGVPPEPAMPQNERTVCNTPNGPGTGKKPPV